MIILKHQCFLILFSPIGNFEFLLSLLFQIKIENLEQWCEVIIYRGHKLKSLASNPAKYNLSSKTHTNVVVTTWCLE